MTAARFWDAQAATFDDAPDHGLTDPVVRKAWADLLLPLLPSTATVADLGCGTGSLAVLLGQAGHLVSGVDIAPEMVRTARTKAAGAGVRVSFVVGDAATPPYRPGTFDVVVSRHVLWAMPSPQDALERWARLLRPGGLLLLVEGRWWTGGGLSSAAVSDLVLRHRGEATVQQLDDPRFWGGPITDERYLLVSRR